jgi:hypothetical protein
MRNRLFWKHDEIAERKYIPAADTRSCPVRECIQVDPETIFRSSGWIADRLRSMASAQIIRFCEAMAAEIRREILIAKLQWGDDDLEIRMIESSWGVTLDDRETLSMIRSVNRTAPSARRLGRG